MDLLEIFYTVDIVGAKWIGSIFNSGRKDFVANRKKERSCVDDMRTSFFSVIPSN